MTTLVWFCAEFRCKRIAFDIPTKIQKVLVSLNRKRLVSPLIKVPKPNHAIVRVIPLRVRQANPLSKKSLFTIDVGADDKMSMIWH